MRNETIIALARVRRAVNALSISGERSEFEVRLAATELRDAINTLDNAGVFHEIDEAVDYASAEEILAESASYSLAKAQGRSVTAGDVDAAEWGDTTAADMARHAGFSPKAVVCTCNATPAHPVAAHAVSCPVWKRHHNL